MFELLFVCKEGLNRSSAGARFFNRWLERDGLTQYRASSCGALATVPDRCIRAGVVEDAYRIIALDNLVANSLLKNFDGIACKMIRMSVPDVYHRDDPEDLQSLETYFSRLYARKNLWMARL